MLGPTRRSCNRLVFRRFCSVRGGGTFTHPTNGSTSRRSSRSARFLRTVCVLSWFERHTGPAATLAIVTREARLRPALGLEWRASVPLPPRSAAMQGTYEVKDGVL